ncbi:GreA/GreB family elongation factor [Moheibacter sediminis]|uniref:Regulator of nucleoside diphosphate kinase n=1 Tax=Moheibacter sediminis TaxID=1434700 RepID=A0A1W2A7G4_9FLAO|nr:GreA/GreB family elongation factor [Moheibacter sediminis]SMC56689.1 regulator of nucleoside diphosphate kinase [Moheibacter sediminis]
MTENIILTTGLYDLIKEQIRRKKVTSQEEQILISELKNAKQVLRKDLSPDIVTVNCRIKVIDHSTLQESEYTFVAPDKEKLKMGKHSILSQIGLATIGRKTGDIIFWPFKDGEKKIEISKVEPFIV